MDRYRWLSLVLAVVLFLTGSPAPVAWAQQPQQATEETPKAPGEPAKEPAGVGYAIAAVPATLVNIPGRIVTCVVGNVVGILTMAITLGSGYRAAAQVVEEGCRGPWILTADDLKGKPTADDMRRY